MKKYIFLVFYILNCINIFGQKASDSLLQLIKKTKETDTIHILALTDWAFQNRSNKGDSALLFAQKAKNLSEKLQFYKGLSKACKVIGIYHHFKGDYSKALEFYFQSITNSEKINDKREIGKVYNNIGYIYRNQGISDKAIDFFLKSLKIDEEFKDSIGISASYNNLGVIFIDQYNFNKALDYYEKALNIRKKMKNKQLLGISYNNIGHAYFLQNKYDTALQNYQIAYQIRLDGKDKRSTIITAGNISTCYIYKNQPDSALPYILKGLQLAEQLKSKEQISYMKNCYAQYFLSKKQAQPAYEIANESQQIAKEIGNIELIVNATDRKYQALEKLGNYKEALIEYQYFRTMQDSIANEKNQKIALSKEWLFKEEKLKAENEAKEKQRELEKQRESTIQIAFIIIVFLLACMFVVLLIAYTMKNKTLKIINKQKNEIAEKNEELNQMNEEISAQRDNLELLSKQLQIKNDEITLKNKSITESIVYANRIQNAILPNIQLFNNYFPHYFIIYKPRDIVSGDFYFINQINNELIIAAGDCTGHGVPGAFMSLLGITILKEIILHKKLNRANLILDELRYKLKLALQQTGQKGETQDGMDIALCVYNPETYFINFAGAYNPLWIVRKQKNAENSETAQLISLDADNQPVGVYIKEEPFTLKTFQLQKNDIIYIFSDGYCSQFGNVKNEKMKRYRFKEILISIYDNSMDEQKKILENNFNEWKGDYEQTDDVIVFGIKI